MKHTKNKNIKSNIKKQQQAKSKTNYTFLILSLTIAIIATYIVYNKSFNFKYTNWDDTQYVRESEIITQLNKQNIKRMFSEEFVSNYHPLTILSYAIDYKRASFDPQTREKDPAPYHQTNIILHLLNVLLVFYFIYLLSGNKIIVAFITAFLFGVHPMHVESVSWISERKDVLYTFFFIASLISYYFYITTKKINRFILSLILYLGAVLSKPAAIPMFAVLLLIDYFVNRIDFKFLKPGTWLKLFTDKKNRAILFEKIPYLLLAAFILYRTYLAQEGKSIAEFKVFALHHRFMFASYGFMMYIVKMIVPFKLSGFYPYPFLDEKGFLPLIYYLAPVIVLIFFVLVLYSERYTKLIVFAVFFYFVMLVMVLQFVSVGKAIMADRYSYVPYISLFFLLGEGFHAAWNSKNKLIDSIKYILLVILVVYLVSMFYLGYERTKVWKNSETLWTDVINKYPEVDVAYKNRGNYYGKELNDLDKALRDYEVLVAMKVNDAEVFSNLGNIYGLRNEFDKSIEAYSKSIAIDSSLPSAYLNRAITYIKMKQYDKAFIDYERALQIDPNNKSIYANRGYTYIETGQYDKAIADFDYLINLYPENDEYYFKRGLAKFNAGQQLSAINDFLKSIQFNPNNMYAYYNVSACYFQLKEYKKSLDFAYKAKSLGYNLDSNYLNKLIELAK